jgi:hypothetical protein
MTLEPNMNSSIDASAKPNLREVNHDTERVGRHRSRRHRVSVPTGLVAGVLLAIVAYRVLVLVRQGQPSGLDFGNWLTIGRQILGAPLPNAAQVTYPPAVPVLTVAFVAAFGLTWGTALLAGLASVAPSLGVYLVLRLSASRWWAFAVTLLVAANSSSGEAAAWGGVPQLLGLGMVIPILYLTHRTLADRLSRTALFDGLLLLGLAATTHLVFAQTVACIVALFAVHIATAPHRFGARSWLGKRGWLSLTSIVVAPSLILAPLYIRLLPTVTASLARGPGDSWPIVSFVQSLEVVYRDASWLWKPSIILTVVVPFLRFRNRRRESSWYLSIALVTGLLVQAFLSGQNRLAYMVPLAVGLSATPALDALQRYYAGRPRRPATLIAVGACAGCLILATSACGLARFPAQRSYYGAIEPHGMVQALDWIRHHTPPHALFAVAPVGGAPFGWWVQGYGHRSALVGSEAQWVYFPEEKLRASQMVLLFSEPNPLSSNVMIQARELSIDYLVFPANWGGLSRSDIQGFQAQHDDGVVFRSEAMTIVKVPG